MDAGTWTGWVSLLISGASAAFAGWAVHVARRADRRVAAATLPVFKIDKFEADDRFTWVTVRNINSGIATQVRIALVDDPDGRVFRPSTTPGMHTGIAEQGAVVTEAAPIGRDGWDVADFDLERGVIVNFRTLDGDEHGQMLKLPLLDRVVWPEQG